MSSLTRSALDALLPSGSAWRPAPGGDLDDLYNGIADSLGAIHDVSQGLAFVRDPNTTPYLSDLEAEFGIITDPYKTDALRRTLLGNRKFTKPLGTLAGLQSALDLAGFGNGGYGLIVYDNNGGADPRNFINGTPNITLSGPGQYLGNTVAQLGYTGGAGTLIVNGPTYSGVTPNIYGCGSLMVGQTVAILGYFTSVSFQSVPYTPPSDSGYWTSFFFLGKSPVYTGSTLTSLSNVSIPSTRQAELIELICRVKPMGTWGVAMINWT